MTKKQSTQAQDKFQAAMKRVAAADAGLAKQRAIEEMNKITPGTLVAGQGVYIGKYRPMNKQRHILGREFNVFAAPYNLASDRQDYETTAQRVAQLKDCAGHNGAAYDNREALYEALKDGSYNGGWVIPPIEIFGKPYFIQDGTALCTDTIYNLRDTGAFLESFPGLGQAFANNAYWACAEDKDETHADYYDMSNKRHAVGIKLNRFLCRPVRFAEVNQP